MEKLYKELIKYHTNSTILLLLDNAIFYSAHTKSKDILQITITKVDTMQYCVEQKMMKGFKSQCDTVIANEYDIIHHISSLQNCVC